MSQKQLLRIINHETTAIESYERKCCCRLVIHNTTHPELKHPKCLICFPIISGLHNITDNASNMKCAFKTQFPPKDTRGSGSTIKTRKTSYFMMNLSGKTWKRKKLCRS